LTDRPRTDPLELLGKQLLGRYTIRDRIAAGGMSVVYRGQDERLQRAVCVKVFFGIDRAHIEYQTNYEHFVQEAFALSQLQHPNTIRIYDFGYLELEPNSPFYVCELMTGGTLQNRVRREGPLAAEAALQILEPIGHALAEAHSRGIVHRDIKPSNILFGAAGSMTIAKLADFGIAKASIEQSGEAIPNRARDTQAMAGVKISLYSPGWAAPEQMRARPVGPTADIYALGLLLAYMTSGKKVFADDNMLETLSNRMEGDTFVTRAIDRLGLPPRLTRIISKACKNEPAERYQTVVEFLAALKEAVAPFGTGTEAVTSPGQAVPWDVTSATPSKPVLVPVEPRKAAGPLLVLANISDTEVVAAGRRVRIVATNAPIDLGGDDDGIVTSKARIRITFLPNPNRGVRVHLKGLNCFVSRAGGRPSSATDVFEDSDIELKAPSRDRLDAVRCQFGSPGDGNVRQYPLGGATLGVPLLQAPHSVLLDFGPGREMVLVYSIRP
jgi:hypothetical protein